MRCRPIGRSPPILASHTTATAFLPYYYYCVPHILLACRALPAGRTGRFARACRSVRTSFLAVYVMQADGRARLDLIQNMEYKFVDLMQVRPGRRSTRTVL